MPFVMLFFGLSAVIWSWLGLAFLAGVSLVLAAWVRSSSGTNPRGRIETAMELICFVIAPIAFVICMCPSLGLAPAILAFFAAGSYAVLVQESSLSDHGYAFPGFALLLVHFPQSNSWPVWDVGLFVSAGLTLWTPSSQSFKSNCLVRK